MSYADDVAKGARGENLLESHVQKNKLPYEWSNLENARMLHEDARCMSCGREPAEELKSSS